MTPMIVSEWRALTGNWLFFWRDFFDFWAEENNQNLQKHSHVAAEHFEAAETFFSVFNHPPR